MGFDPDRETRMKIPVSDTRAYKQFGNAVVVPVVADIAGYMRPHIMQIIDNAEPRAAVAETTIALPEQMSVQIG